MTKCNECKFALLQDMGYSDYTTEGTDLICTKGLNPNGQFDTFYGEASELEFAEQCPEFTEGGPGAHLCTDVCKDDWERMEPEEQAFAIEHYGKPWWMEGVLTGVTV